MSSIRQAAPLKNNPFFILLSVILLTIANCQVSFAQRVEPMVFELAASGSKSTTSLRVNNNKSAPLTIEVIPSRISLDEHGKETRTLAEDDFLIYPPQTILQPGKTQVIKVKYVGDPTIEASQAYRISVNQVPVNLGLDESSSLGLLLNFNTLANVVPAKAKSELNVTDIKLGTDGNWVVTIKNSGNRFARLSQTKWTAASTSDSGNKKSFKKEEVNNMIDKKLVLPNSTLITNVKAIDGFSPENTTITITN